MEHRAELEITLPNVSVQLATVVWEGVEEIPPYPVYSLSQRLSENHSALRIGNLRAAEALPRVRSVGLLPPGCPVQLYPIGKPLRVFLCTFDETFFQRTTETTCEQWSDHAGQLVSMRSQRIELMMQQLHAELLRPDFGHELLVEATSTLLLVELARYARNLDERSDEVGMKSPLAPWQLRRIQERIQASLELGYPDLGELARICGVSQGHLARTFKAATGWQIHKYICEERLKAAKVMLAEEHLSCEAISAQLGFKSQAYFSTVFRRMTGKTPSEYRHHLVAGRDWRA